LIADYLYLKLGDDIDGPVGIIRDIEIKQGIFELFLSRRFRQDWGWFDIYAGIRSWDFGLRLIKTGWILWSAGGYSTNFRIGSSQVSEPILAVSGQVRILPIPFNPV
jgi:hypothetical protein